MVAMVRSHCLAIQGLPKASLALAGLGSGVDVVLLVVVTATACDSRLTTTIH